MPIIPLFFILAFLGWCFSPWIEEDEPVGPPMSHYYSEISNCQQMHKAYPKTVMDSTKEFFREEIRQSRFRAARILMARGDHDFFGDALKTVNRDCTLIKVRR